MHVLAVVFDSGSLCYNVVADVALRMLESLNAGGPYLYYLLYFAGYFIPRSRVLCG